ncbi:hypothetical protein F2Q68_00005216 [Brassica cretica]|uniref:Uncharacterized protein n=1 Tax=Brassica cretica TaxID=69181 RepID=A0A8S9JLK7_BRACR|nr:hypothetical protein F2Q68_00005216 [Brassica cretica]
MIDFVYVHGLRQEFEVTCWRRRTRDRNWIELTESKPQNSWKLREREREQGKLQQHTDADTVGEVCLCGGLGFFVTLGMLVVVDDKASKRNQRIRQEWRLDSLAKEKKKL